MRRAVLACVVATLAGAPAAAQQAEEMEVPSLTLTNEQFLAGDAAAGTPVTLTGRLNLPGDAPRYPAVVLLHGSDGPSSGSVGGWQWVLRPLGAATFSLDGFTGRAATESAKAAVAALLREVLNLP